MPAFALIEVIAALSIITVSSTYFISTIARIREAYMQYITKSNVNVLIKLLANFVAQNGRLPYPAGIDGFELPYDEWPEDEDGWELPDSKLMRGIIPYRTLGINENKAKDGYGYFLTYRVNPTLCGRKSVRSVPPGTLRERFESYGSELDQNLYSCYTCVRSYKDRYSQESLPEVQTKIWDIAFRVYHAQIKCYTNGVENKLYNSYSLIAPYQHKFAERSLDPIEVTKYVRLLDASDPELLYRKQTTDYPIEADKKNYTSFIVKDCIALVIISHGPSHGGAFLSNGKVAEVPKNASIEKIQNSNSSSDPSICYTNSTNPGMFDDTVFWVSRFELASIGDFHMRPFNILRNNSIVNPDAKPSRYIISDKGKIS